MIATLVANRLNRLNRRTLLIWPFAVATVALLLLGLMPTAPTPMIVTLFVLYALAIGGPTILQWIYPNELFPTAIRATAVGLGTTVTYPATYQPGANTTFAADRDLYGRIGNASPDQRIQVESFIIPPRSGRAWEVPADAVCRIVAVDGPRVGDLNVWHRHNPRERMWAYEDRYFMKASPAQRGDFLEFFDRAGSNTEKRQHTGHLRHRMAGLRTSAPYGDRRLRHIVR
ncbi:DUF1989 domain-containing protein [Saccharopolyspora hattusasensis]|uniref:DUF1989 domain-containing protein n=1 Tax=Saccharopolyspora hattusasensis TaxID=1128679 RepID=UPI003D998928